MGRDVEVRWGTITACMQCYTATNLRRRVCVQDWIASTRVLEDTWK